MTSCWKTANKMWMEDVHEGSEDDVDAREEQPSPK
jgi:hypothetical protein